MKYDPKLAKWQLIIKSKNSTDEKIVTLKGEISVPICHFELPQESNDEGSWVIRIESIGH